MWCNTGQSGINSANDGRREETGVYKRKLKLRLCPNDCSYNHSLSPFSQIGKPCDMNVKVKADKYLMQLKYFEPQPLFFHEQEVLANRLLFLPAKAAFELQRLPKSSRALSMFTAIADNLKIFEITGCYFTD